MFSALLSLTSVILRHRLQPSGFNLPVKQRGLLACVIPEVPSALICVNGHSVELLMLLVCHVPEFRLFQGSSEPSRFWQGSRSSLGPGGSWYSRRKMATPWELMGSEAGLIAPVKSDVKKILMTMLTFHESEIGPHMSYGGGPGGLRDPHLEKKFKIHPGWSSLLTFEHLKSLTEALADSGGKQ